MPPAGGRTVASGGGGTPDQLGVGVPVVGQGGRLDGAVVAQVATGVFGVVVVAGADTVMVGLLLAVVVPALVVVPVAVVVVVVEPEVVDPEVVEPEVVDPEVVEPEVVDPEVVEPEVVEPEVVDPEVVDPEVVDPEVVEPEVVEPEVVEPEVVDPEVVEPEVVDPEVVEPEVVDPDVVEPEVVAPVVVGFPEVVEPEVVVFPDGVDGFHCSAGGMPGTSPFGGSTCLSTISIRPVSRENQPPVSKFTRMISVTGFGAGTTTTSVFGWKPVQVFPVYLALLTSFGGCSGLPQAQRTRGTPWASTRTAVPACSADWYSTTAPLL
ncbi:hypothetical protein GCM10018790_58270 [Kitasatospora xanthocidica]|nr:hypothetical protein GCM10018790_58270 [Kitasatospora xanthocidica]